MAGHRWIDDDTKLKEVIAELLAEPTYAVDTEFHRERTYFPQLALLQLGWGDQIALVDPLAVDIAPLADVLDGPGVVVMHAAAQDLEVLELACGTVPGRLFDTQVAAGFLGYATPSLAVLHERILDIKLAKGDRLTDWLHRPLAADQLTYAAADVAHLLELHRRLTAELEERGRLRWAEDECELVRRRAYERRDPEESWRRIKEVRQLRGRAAGVAQAVAAWRERRAAEVDQPVRFVLPDLAVVGIAQHPPKQADDLKAVRGLDGRHLRNGAADQIVAATRAGLDRPASAALAAIAPEVDRALRPAISLVSAWISQLARDLELDTSLLATRADIEALLRGDDDARLGLGWRADVVGEPIRRLVDGDAALAFDGHGGLTLEARSRQPLAE
ncbi:ribonuclease D [soil metagenome]